MKSPGKTFYVILGYCAFLWVTNWSLSHTYDRDLGLIASSLDLRGLGAFLGIALSLFYLRQIWKTLRIFLDKQIRIPQTARLYGSWAYLLLLFPLAINTRHIFHRTTGDGTTTTTVFEYGGGPSIASVLLSAMAIMLYQTHLTLKSHQTEKPEPA
ncbi:MAG: hypothetical protein LAT55_10855 [Opitutales bacterium]|nr:hypothetical protein [Opitutales bacterium]